MCLVFKNFIIFNYGYVCENMYIHLHAVPKEAKRGHHIPQN